MELQELEEASPLTPEARRKRLSLARERMEDTLERLRPGARTIEVLKRVFSGAYNDGFIHAGNLAFLTLLTLFPFFIVMAALASVFGRTDDGLRALREFLATIPPDVASVLEKPVVDVLQARSGSSLFWLGAIAGLWSTGGFIATIKDIIYRAYGVVSSSSFWKSRLRSTAVIVGAVLLVLISFVLQAVLAGAEQFIVRLLPFADRTLPIWLSLGRLVPGLFIFGALYLMFLSMTPRRYRGPGCKKWPGPLFIAIWWLLVTSLLPAVLALLGGYDLTYGSLAGVMIALVYFFTIGLGVVIGAHLNAALAESSPSGLMGANIDAIEESV